MSERVLVTGAAGFVGRVLTGHLKDAGYDVVASDLAVPGNPDYVQCDVSDPDSVERLFAAAGKVETVVHLAAASSVAEALESPTGVMRTNLLGTIHIADAMRRHRPDARLLFVGSSEAYGSPRHLPVDEMHPLAPESPYAVSKAAADHYCAFLSRSDMLTVFRARPFNHSGPGQRSDFVLSSFARQIALIEAGKQSPVLRVGNLDVRRDFLHVDDVVAAYLAILERGHPGMAYNICSGEARLLSDALQQLCAMSATPIAIETDPARLRPVDVPEIRGTYAQLEAATGWKPHIRFDQLLRELLDYWRKRIGADR